MGIFPRDYILPLRRKPHSALGRTLAVGNVLHCVCDGGSSLPARSRLTVCSWMVVLSRPIDQPTGADSLRGLASRNHDSNANHSDDDHNFGHISHKTDQRSIDSRSPMPVQSTLQYELSKHKQREIRGTIDCTGAREIPFGNGKSWTRAS